jgi:hypothetical protein
MISEERKKDITFILFLVIVAILASLYFSAPEKSLFFEKQLLWWNEFREAASGFLN